MILGTVAAVDANNGITVIVDGEEVASEKKYSYLASYVPAANDKVIIEEISGSYVILGKICTAFDESGHAQLADIATNAVNATSADFATRADTARVSESCSGNASTASRATNATHAETADTATVSSRCSGNAATATVANRCSGAAASAALADEAVRARTAYWADSSAVSQTCTGNAATATTATRATTANNISVDSSNVSYGAIVTSVTRTWNSDLGIYLITDMNLSGTHNFAYTY